MSGFVRFTLPGFPGERMMAGKVQWLTPSGKRQQIQLCDKTGQWAGSVDHSVDGFSKAADLFQWRTRRLDAGKDSV